MTFTCTGLYSLDETRCGFVIPAFTSSDSNDVFFQDLTIDGKVDRFVKVDTSYLYSVPIFPPALTVSIGDFGLLAFVDDEGSLEIGIPVALAKSIEPSLVADPITRIELASLRADRTMQKSAIRKCEKIFSGSERFERWAKREKRLFRRVLKDFDPDHVGVDDFQAKLDRDFQELEANLEGRGWGQKWLRLWGQGFDKRRLIGIAYLRQDLGQMHDIDVPEIYRVILENQWTEEARARALEVLKATGLDSSGWFQLFIRALYRSSSNRDEIFDLGLGALETEIGRFNSRVPSQWIGLWQFLLREPPVRRYIHRIGTRMINSLDNIKLNVARSMLVPLSYDHESYQEIEHKITEWVIQNVRSDTVWANLFIQISRNGSVQFVEDIGIKWLHELGGNLSQWIDIWHVYRDEISDEQYVYLGLSWLGRARKDMKSWVNVYFELFEEFEVKRNREFFKLGVEWIESRQGSASNRRRVAQALTYMEALSRET